MFTHHIPNQRSSDAVKAQDAFIVDQPMPTKTRMRQGGFRYSSHGRAALATALDNGLMPDEVRHILAGRRVANAFPVWRGENPEAYATRTVSEMFAIYLG